MKVVAAMATVLLATGGLSACSGNDAYCGALRTNDAAISDFDTDVDKMLTALRQVQDKAPSEVKDDWKTVVDGFEKLKAAEKDPEAAKSLQADDAKITAATEKIQKHAKDECNIDISS